jgi:Tol biopolymer transport system component
MAASLVFFTWGAEPNRIWRVARSGGVPVPITPARAEHDGYPDVSPDGRFLAFARTEGGEVRVHVMPVEGGEARRLTASPSTVPRWSPDGKLIAFARDRAYDGGIFVIGADGRGERRLTQTGGWPVWRPDGARIAYSAIGVDGNQEIRVVPSRGGPSTPLASIHYSGINYTFDIAPDGGSLVTSNITSSSTEVWLLEPAPGK